MQIDLGGEFGDHLAQMGSKVLLIDSDFRRPILHMIFNLDRRVGLSNVLGGVIFVIKSR